MLKIKQEISENKAGLQQAKQVMDIIYKKTGVRYHEVHIYRLLHKWGFSAKVPQKRFVNTASKEEKKVLKGVQGLLLQIPKGFAIAVHCFVA